MRRDGPLRSIRWALWTRRSRNGIGQGGIADGLVPVGDRELAGDDRGPGGIPVIEEFQEVAAMAVIEGFDAEVVEDQDVDPGELAHQFGIAAVAAGDFQVDEELWQSLVEGFVPFPAGFLGQRTGKIGLADPGGRRRGIVSRSDRVGGGSGNPGLPGWRPG